jgi:flagellar hook-length control protein FliK
VAAGRVYTPAALDARASLGRGRDVILSATEGAPLPVRRGTEIAAPLVLPALAAESGRDATRSQLTPLASSMPLSGSAPLDDVLPAQIIRSFRLLWQAGQGEARVQLRPEYLGELTVAVKVEQGAVTATLHAEAPEVRRWLESHSTSLREALAEHGLKLDRLIVVDERGRQDAAGTDRRQRQRQAEDEGEAPSRRRRDQPADGRPTFDPPTSETHERTHV